MDETQGVGYYKKKYAQYAAEVHELNRINGELRAQIKELNSKERQEGQKLRNLKAYNRIMKDKIKLAKEAAKLGIEEKEK